MQIKSYQRHYEVLQFVCFGPCTYNLHGYSIVVGSQRECMIPLLSYSACVSENIRANGTDLDKHILIFPKYSKIHTETCYWDIATKSK